MRARLNRQQVEMLLNGESLKNGRQRFGINLKNKELVDFLKKYAESEEMRKKVSLLLNMSTGELEAEFT